MDLFHSIRHALKRQPMPRRVKLPIKIAEGLALESQLHPWSREYGAWISRPPLAIKSRMARGKLTDEQIARLIVKEVHRAIAGPTSFNVLTYPKPTISALFDGEALRPGFPDRPVTIANLLAYSKHHDLPMVTLYRNFAESRGYMEHAQYRLLPQMRQESRASERASRASKLASKKSTKKK